MRGRVAHDVHPAALCDGVQHAPHGRLQPLMGVGDDELHAAQAVQGE